MSFTRLQQIQQSLNSKFYDREAEIEALMTALLARQHILFIGPAGTGKSALSSMLGEMVEGSHYFQHLLTPFSTPEELFGVLSLKDLEQGVYKRNVTGMLPEAHFSFIDEIFKANSAILNSLLTLINERVFYNNGVPIQSPLMTIVGSSNEYIEEGEGLEALFDRFLLRYEVDYIREQDEFIAMLKNDQNLLVPKLTLQELYEHQERVQNVHISDNVFSSIAKIRQSLHDEGIRPSDRRFKQSLSILKAKAYLDNRQEVSRSDLLLLVNVLWETIEQREKTEEIINDIALDTIESFINRVGPEFELILLHLQNAMISNAPNSRSRISELLMQGKTLFLEVQAMNREAPNRQELQALKNDIHKRLLKMTTDVIGF
ncbi:AAA family ATPase [Solibacillus sp. FSL H8-0538]|uniref:AAA family ATPase n=1 Tax=Solibacillus sp. FSL H8-0538 TaxID=2921400 RepID=UPI0030F5005B